MFQQRTQPTSFSGILTMSEVVFHSIVRSVRSKHNNAFIALALNLMQTLMLVAAFYLLFSLLNL